MAVGDDMMDDSRSTLIPDTVNLKQSGDVLSPEDIVWADSCLIKDPEISDVNANSLKTFLLETLSSQSDSPEFSTAEKDGSSGVRDIEILSSNEENETSQNLERTAVNIVPSNVGAENSSDYHLIYEKTDTFWSRINLENVFLPTYSEACREIENSDSKVNLGFPAFVMESSSEDIFKVWDLDISDDEDEFIKQLNEALAESSLEDIPSTSYDSGARKGLNEQLLDNIISGIEDLSLNKIYD